MLISLCRKSVGYLLDFILTSRFKNFIPHNQPLTEDQLTTIRELNTGYFLTALSNLVGHSINETRVRLVDLELLSKGLLGVLGLTGLVLVCSLAWTEVTGLLVILAPVTLGMLIYTLFLGKDLVKSHFDGRAENNVHKRSVSFCLFFIAKVILIQMMLIITVLMPDPAMLLVVVLFAAGMLALQAYELNCLLTLMLTASLTKSEFAVYLAKTRSLYSEWWIHHFEAVLAKGEPLTIGIIQRYQLLTDSTDTQGD
ncbi:hypothetical protein V0M98_36200 (plasmid) [Pseudomonas silesiensis]|uniref:hypothetical protein n=1 Tax=Pseudomonas silesiensis TaxID=1853130 RepID=UPI0030D11C85